MATSCSLLSFLMCLSFYYIIPFSIVFLHASIILATTFPSHHTSRQCTSTLELFDHFAEEIYRGQNRRNTALKVPSTKDPQHFLSGIAAVFHSLLRYCESDERLRANLLHNYGDKMLRVQSRVSRVIFKSFVYRSTIMSCVPRHETKKVHSYLGYVSNGGV